MFLSFFFDALSLLHLLHWANLGPGDEEMKRRDRVLSGKAVPANEQPPSTKEHPQDSEILEG